MDASKLPVRDTGQGERKPARQLKGRPWGWLEADPGGVFFSDRFNVHPDVMAKYGAFDISVVSDLPVFIDPFWNAT